MEERELGKNLWVDYRDNNIVLEFWGDDLNRIFLDSKQFENLLKFKEDLDKEGRGAG